MASFKMCLNWEKGNLGEGRREIRERGGGRSGREEEGDLAEGRQ